MVFIIFSCSYFDEPEKILPGKRENVFDFDDNLIVKSNQKIIINKSVTVNTWSQQYQNERNHLFHFKSNTSLKLKKKLRLKNLAFDKIDHVTIPVFNEKNIFYADNEHNIYSLNIEKNIINWRQRLAQEKKEELPFIGGFSLSDNLLFITTGLGFVHAIDASNGKKIWSKNFLAQFSRPPLSFGKLIYVVSDDNQTFALDRKGNLVWSHSGNLEEVSIIGGSKPIIHDNILIVSYSSGEIYALNSADGSLIWFDNITSGNFFNRSALNDIQSPLTIVRDKVYVPSFSDKFIVYDLFTGDEVWNLKLSSLNPVVVSGRTIYLIDTTGRLLCLDRENGKLLWAVQLKISNDGDEITWYGPLLTSNKIILTNSIGSVISISPFTGKLMSKINLSEELVANPIQYGKQLILISKKGTLFILG